MLLILELRNLEKEENSTGEGKKKMTEERKLKYEYFLKFPEKTCRVCNIVI